MGWERTDGRKELGQDVLHSGENVCQWMFMILAAPEACNRVLVHIAHLDGRYKQS